MTSDLDQRIRDRAYEIWQAEGEPHGRDASHWEKARAEFAEAANATASPTTMPRAKSASRAPASAKPAAKRATKTKKSAPSG